MSHRYVLPKFLWCLLEIEGFSPQLFSTFACGLYHNIEGIFQLRLESFPSRCGELMECLRLLSNDRALPYLPLLSIHTPLLLGRIS